ncbi:fumarate hydratase [Acetivibrio straminisolvens JCM 21531]|uniref:Fumarate hydratase n=1 Tax=Acetivibrio straminisolvens JCM 21531 TaxID=1294263 RepID=W4V896_9FIRM|nr:fumarate hydratase [Acetivibrio straminisolvens JCM 21531]
MKHIIEAPLTEEKARELRAGDIVSINGIIYTARDAAHKKMVSLVEEGKPLPFDIRDQIIYYVGPCPAKPEKSLVLQVRQPAAGWMPMLLA